MSNNEIIRDLARTFIKSEFTTDHTMMGSIGHKKFIDKVKIELQRFYEIESKMIFLDEVQIIVNILLDEHQEKCEKGKDCYTYSEYQKSLFFLGQEINTLPKIVHSKLSDDEKLYRDKVFICYARKDKKWLDLMYRHFKPFENKVDVWFDGKISPGQKWKEEIEKTIGEARIAILLISADFFNSDFILKNELPPLLKAADEDGAIILGVVLKPCMIDEYPEIHQYQMINSPSNTIIQMTEAERELTWIELAKQLKKELID